ncbi:hydrolase [Pseudoclavibacter endophyticus]|uniref:Carbon-nitrogen family hydrolase n=1 Tax=Pseudoclavibacter endophyticus TaxID=1778590 RepID=A0A6H9WU11_9MICO|nr:nitrilase-related carbon-nitrogen hydrolase [Pseudoclavibacter endophyticus]KAB1649740.1 carbon-nitrogen family hydrolase [Pseudoclavibacter endophyticus]GGA60111.1 hydrolase [Pseudoclavibacter endophyticus]
MKIGLLQVSSPDDESPADRRRRVRDRLLAHPDALDLIVLPELWSAGYFHFDRYAELAESPADSPTLAVAAQVARERGCWVHAGSFVERRPSGALRNTAALVAPDGAVAQQYSKVHVFGYRSLEAELLEPGDAVSVAQTPFGPTTGVTCYDLRFPPLWDELVGIGAELVVVPAAWPLARSEHWRLLTGARAVDNQVIVVACNATGTHGGVEAGGHSRVVDPWGRVLGEAGTAEEWLVVDVDPTVVTETRNEFPVLRDRIRDYAALSSADRNQPAREANAP